MTLLDTDQIIRFLRKIIAIIFRYADGFTKILKTTLLNLKAKLFHSEISYGFCFYKMTECEES